MGLGADGDGGESSPYQEHNVYASHTPLAARQDCARRVAEAYPDRVPVILQTLGDGVVLSQTKFLVPKSTRLGAFLVQARRFTQYDGAALPPTKALYLLVGDQRHLGSLSASLADVKARYTSDDGLVYMWLVTENTFG